MARGVKVVVNRAAFTEWQLGVADGLFEAAKDALAATKVPDAPPYGQGLVEGGGALAWLDGKKVGGTTIGGRAISKPRGLRTARGEAVAIVGFGFPGRFVELGTVDTAANPFTTAGVMSVVGNVPAEVGAGVAKRLGR